MTELVPSVKIRRYQPAALAMLGASASKIAIVAILILPSQWLRSDYIPTCATEHMSKS